MKAIQVSDVMYDFLMDLSRELKSQDNRGTRSPYYFQIEEEREECAPEGCGVEVWVADGEVHLRNERDIREAVFDYKGWDEDNEEDIALFDKLDEHEIESILEENYRKVEVGIVKTYDNIFFTEKAYLEHLERNRHNLTNPKSYLFHAYRNKEMKMIFQFLEGLTDIGKEAKDE